ncbi:MAG TPA: Gfo/Idh/MocA family oxidoreductase [Sphingobacteriaceae bacterium]
MQQPIISGILSYGMSGKVFHAPFLSRHPGFRLRAVTERSRKLAKTDYPDIISYDSVEELLADPEISLVVVNTPNNTHAEFAKKALAAGKDVLVEKPFATSAAEAREVFELGKSLGRKVLVYQNRRYSSDFMAAKAVVESGELGRIIEVHLRFDRYRNFIGPKVFKESPVPGSGIFYDLGAHMIDQAISLFGKPVKSAKTLGRYREGTQVDDYGTIHLKFENDLNVFITVSMLVAAPTPAIVIHGTNGSFIKELCDTQEEQLMAGRFPDEPGFGQEPAGMEGRLTTVGETGEKKTVPVPSLVGRYMEVFNDVYDAIRQGKPYPVREDQILSQMELLEMK